MEWLDIPTINFICFIYCGFFFFFPLKWQSVLFPIKALNSCFKQWHSWRISHHAIPFPCTITICQWIASLLVSEEKSFTFTSLLISVLIYLFSVLQVVRLTSLFFQSSWFQILIVFRIPKDLTREGCWLSAWLLQGMRTVKMEFAKHFWYIID